MVCIEQAGLTGIHHKINGFLLRNVPNAEGKPECGFWVKREMCCLKPGAPWLASCINFQDLHAEGPLRVELQFSTPRLVCFLASESLCRNSVACDLDKTLWSFSEAISSSVWAQQLEIQPCLPGFFFFTFSYILMGPMKSYHCSDKKQQRKSNSVERSWFWSFKA